MRESARVTLGSLARDEEELMKPLHVHLLQFLDQFQSYTSDTGNIISSTQISQQLHDINTIKQTIEFIKDVFNLYSAFYNREITPNHCNFTINNSKVRVHPKIHNLLAVMFFQTKRYFEKSLFILFHTIEVNGNQNCVLQNIFFCSFLVKQSSLIICK